VGNSWAWGGLEGKGSGSRAKRMLLRRLRWQYGGALTPSLVPTVMLRLGGVAQALLVGGERQVSGSECSSLPQADRPPWHCGIATAPGKERGNQPAVGKLKGTPALQSSRCDDILRDVCVFPWREN